MSFRKLLGLDRSPGGAAAGNDRNSSETVRTIVDRLERLEPERARYIAAFSYVLSRVAHADLGISPEETREMERLARDRAGLDENEATLVVHMAKSRAVLFAATENYIVTREFARIATIEQKRGLLDCLFAVSAADETISGTEESEIRRIVAELDLAHADFIAARAGYLEYVAVLKKRPLPGTESPH